MGRFRKKMLTFVMIVSALLLVGQSSIAAEGSAPDIRVGVVPEAESITVGSDGDFTITDKQTGEVLFEGSGGEATVTLGSSAEVHTNYRLQVAWTTSDAYVDDWVNRANLAGYPTYVESYNGGYRLFIGEFDADASWSERSVFRNQMIAEGFAAGDSFWKVVTFTEGVKSLIVNYDGQEKTIGNAVAVSSSTGLVTINGKTYRGMGEVGFNSKGTLAGINELLLEEYLYGVVPHELPPVPYGELEAQKAQAVAARTYAISNLGKRSADGYDLLPTTSDQVYGGYESEHPISTQAIQETNGLVATYDGKLITAVYSSTTGGYTANNEDVWDSEPVAYLRGVPDAERGKALQHVPDLSVFKNSSHATSLRAAKEGDFEADWSKYHRWTFEWTPEEISDVLSSYFSTDVGEVYEINVTKRSNSGRVLEIEYVTENGTFYEEKDRVRWSLKYINSRGGQSVLLSTLFYIEPTKGDNEGGFVVYGGGWGHGVGLSQTGAVGMATKGYTVDQILKHYYQGIELEVRY